MIIDKTYWGNDTFHFGLYKGLVAYDDFYKNIIYVFKDVSAKRIKLRWLSDEINRRNRKVIYISNEQLLNLNFRPDDYFKFLLIRKIIFDGKLGTRYESSYKGGCSSGDYFWCVRNGTVKVSKVQ